MANKFFRDVEYVQGGVVPLTETRQGFLWQLITTMMGHHVPWDSRYDVDRVTYLEKKGLRVGDDLHRAK